MLIKDDTLARCDWTMGRIIKEEKDEQGYVRSVTVKTLTSELRRPVHKLVLLITKEEQSG